MIQKGHDKRRKVEKRKKRITKLGFVIARLGMRQLGIEPRTFRYDRPEV